MARPPRKYPTPQMHLRNKAYRIRWYAFSKWFEFSLGNVQKDEAQRICFMLGAAFANKQDYPEEIIHQPAVKRYIALTNNITDDADDSRIIMEYIAHMNATFSSKWPSAVKYHLKRALEQMGSLIAATTGQIEIFLDIVTNNTSPATRNRTWVALSGFYRWTRKTGYLPKGYNPMEGIKKLREDRREDGIIIWEPNEVKALLKAADKRKDGIAVWIAILAGLRRGEIARLKWSDITEAYIIIQKTKTGPKRQVPISSALAKRLKKENRTDGKVVPWMESINSWHKAAERLVEKHLPKLLPEIHKKNPEKFGWNPFRHTFASRLAQAGLSLEIISAWMGNSPKICKEHYARYVPKTMRDQRIDAVDIDL